ncbi:nucleotide sugar dehydrogenase [Pseudonocardia sp. KRD291]|uniref:nucleotide sugar dehydrogenase n=1 Tax=Pseudonocardia sp. KRD291 TaxID=2792007 RepID=UPI001C4A3D2E|nr:nucleotide sugar dehydrogenase [Pseudonocardia sp. KRD291]MBW0101549.1 nucleotide sugar dehydrogenase [Pseudonocardia sp. KRD291]
MKVTVVGLGKIGLPLAVQFALGGHHVVGADVDDGVVSTVRAARPPFPGEAELVERLGQVVGEGRLEATADTTSAVAVSDVVVTVVPLYVDADGRPDFRALDAATASIGAGLRPGTLVSFETTLPVGTTRDRLAPLLERTSGLTAGADFFLAFSPERVSSGRVFADLARYPKLVGGVDPESGQRATAFYADALTFDERPDLARPNGVWDLGSAEAAELAKLAETTYRDVNIGLANQFASYADSIGVDFGAVARACNSQPFSHLHQPGIAVGGHCIPVYPWFYLAGDPDATIVRAARAANADMPDRCVDRLAKACGGLGGSPIAVLGACYRGGVRETAFSGVYPVVRALERHGAEALVHDPLYTPLELDGLGLRAYRRGDPVVAAVLQADHREYRSWTPADLPGVRVVLDGRHALDPARWPGVEMLSLGGGPM